MKFKDWVSWIFVKGFTKKLSYYKRRDGKITLTVKNCDKSLKEIANFWRHGWEKVSTNFPDLSFSGLRAYDFYWDNVSLDVKPTFDTPKEVEVSPTNFYIYLISDKTGAERRLNIYSVLYTFKGKDLVVDIDYEYIDLHSDPDYKDYYR